MTKPVDSTQPVTDLTYGSVFLAFSVQIRVLLYAQSVFSFQLEKLQLLSCLRLLSVVVVLCWILLNRTTNWTAGLIRSEEESWTTERVFFSSSFHSFTVYVQRQQQMQATRQRQQERTEKIVPLYALLRRRRAGTQHGSRCSCSKNKFRQADRSA